MSNGALSTGEDESTDEVMFWKDCKAEGVIKKYEVQFACYMASSLFPHLSLPPRYPQ